MPKAVRELAERNQDKFELKKKFEVGDIWVYVDLYDSVNETAYMV